MGIGHGTGEGRAVKAAQEAIANPLLEATISGATGVLVNVTGGPNMGILEINQALEIIHDAADDSAEVIFGTAINPEMQDEIKITVIATGFDKQAQVSGAAPAAPTRNQARRPMSGVRAPVEATQVSASGMKVVGGAPAPAPAPASRGPVGSGEAPGVSALGTDEYDIPSFLRRRR